MTRYQTIAFVLFHSTLALVTRPSLAAESAPCDFGSIKAGSGTVAQYVLTLAGADGGGPLTMRIWARDGTFRQAWATGPSQPGYCHALIASHTGFYNVPPEIGLKQESGKLTGTVRLGGSKDFEIAAAVSGTSLNGQYKAFAVERGKRGKAAGQGKLTGKILSESDLKRTVSPLAKGAWVAGFRHDASGVGFETGAALVESPFEARVVWHSEELVFPPYHEGINFSKPCGIQGGHASPMLWDGKIYINQFWGIPSETDDPKGIAQAIAKAKENTEQKGKPPLHIPREMMLRKYARSADQVMTCIDAGTGRTLWRVVFPDAGPNISRGGSDSRHKLCGPSSKAASHLSACVVDGMVYFKGTANNIYALDANTGELKWEAAKKQKGKGGKDSKGRRISAWGKGSTHTDTMQYAGGVVATLKHIPNTTPPRLSTQITGLDARTGKVLWHHVSLVSGRGATALRWVHKGKEYFLTTGGACIEPKSGKILWKIEGWDNLGYQFAADEDLLFVAKEKSCAGYRVSPQKAEKLWETEEIARDRMIFPVLYKGHAFMRTRQHPKGIEQTLWKGDFSPMKDNGRLTQDWCTICVDMASGKVVGCAYGSKSYASVTAGDGRIFNCCAVTVAYQDGDPSNYRDLPYDKSKGSYRGPADHGSPCTVLYGCPETGGAYADGRFFSRTFDGIVCYDLRKL
jgi:outer membrane protein assembly factor BamB